MSTYTVENIILLAKKRHWEELQKLSASIEFVETIGWIIHQIQIERGLSCLYLASYGQRMAEARVQVLEDNQVLEQRFKQGLQAHLDQQCNTDAKQLTLISWILLGFDELKSLRYKVTLIKISFADCIQSYNRFISSLISLIFEITDRTVNSNLSVYLLALYNLVQGKEFAGQERAVGSFLFGSGQSQHVHQQKLSELIALQDRHFELFCQFSNPTMREAWQMLAKSEQVTRHQSLRTKLLNAEDQQILQSRQGDYWFELCSQRLTGIWQLQCQLIQAMHEVLRQLITKAHTDLQVAEKYLANLQGKPSNSSTMDSYFYNLDIPVETAFSFFAQDQSSAYPVESIMSLLQQQSQQIAEIEHELSATKKALSERKQIERAKGLLMHQLSISEVDAYKVMRSTAMAQNRKLIDIAENILAQS